MKKYLLAFMALLAGIAFSAFTPAENAGKKNTALADPYYWYHVNAFQTQTSGSTVNPSQRELKTVYLTEDCLDDEDTPICLVGFSEEVSSGTTVPSDPDRIIRETENP
jgi:hypothetical protein